MGNENFFLGRAWFWRGLLRGAKLTVLNVAGPSILWYVTSDNELRPRLIEEQHHHNLFIEEGTDHLVCTRERMESLHSHPSNPNIVFGVSDGRWYGRDRNKKQWLFLGKQDSIDDALHKYMKIKTPKDTQTFHMPDFIELTYTRGFWYGRITPDAPASMTEVLGGDIDIGHHVRYRRRLGKNMTLGEAIAKYRELLGIAEPPEVPMSDLPKRPMMTRATSKLPKPRCYEQRNGVYRRDNGKYVASIQKHHIRLYLGLFNTMEEANRAMEKYKPLITKEVANSRELEAQLRMMIATDIKERKHKHRSSKGSSVSGDASVSSNSLEPSPAGSETLWSESDHVEQTMDHDKVFWGDDLLFPLSLDEMDALIAM